MKLDDWLQKNTVNYSAFARKIGVSYHVFYNWRRGKTVPKAKYIHKICKATGGEVSFLDFVDTQWNKKLHNKIWLCIRIFSVYRHSSWDDHTFNADVSNMNGGNMFNWFFRKLGKKDAEIKAERAPTENDICKFGTVWLYEKDKYKMKKIKAEWEKI